MWDESDDEKYQKLTQRYSKNPLQEPSKEDLDLVFKLWDEFQTVGKAKGFDGNSNLYPKVIQLLNVFYDYALTDELISDPQKYLKAMEGAYSDSFNSIPFAKELNKKYTDEIGDIFYERLDLSTISTFPEKEKLINSLKAAGLSPIDLEQFKSDIDAQNTMTINLLDDPRAKVNASVPLSERIDKDFQNFITADKKRQNYSKVTFVKETYSFDKQVEWAFNNVLEKLPTSSDPAALEPIKDAFVIESYRRKQYTSLATILGGFSQNNPDFLRKIPHIYFTATRPKQKDALITDLSIDQLLPHHKFGMALKYIEGDPYLRGLLLVQENPKFKNWDVLPKTIGAEAGFILKSQDGSRYFVKKTDSIYIDHYYSKILSEMGIKMPESMVLMDEFNHPLFVTQDLSRQYAKSGTQKTKHFHSLEDAVTKDPNFVENHFKDPKIRQSFAKIIMISSLYGLKDVITQGGNIGPYEVSKKGADGQIRTTLKFGICDFLPKASGTILTSESNMIANAQAYIAAEAAEGGFPPYLTKMLNQITQDDWQAVVKDISSPKLREHNSEGMLLVKQGHLHSDPIYILEKTYQEVLCDLRNKISDPIKYNEIANEISTRHKEIVANFTRTHAPSSDIGLQQMVKTISEVGTDIRNGNLSSKWATPVTQYSVIDNINSIIKNNMTDAIQLLLLSNEYKGNVSEKSGPLSYAFQKAVHENNKTIMRSFMDNAKTISPEFLKLAIETAFEKNNITLAKEILIKSQTKHWKVAKSDIVSQLTKQTQQKPLLEGLKLYKANRVDSQSVVIAPLKTAMPGSSKDKENSQPKSNSTDRKRPSA